MCVLPRRPWPECISLGRTPAISMVAAEVDDLVARAIIATEFACLCCYLDCPVMHWSCRTFCSVCGRTPALLSYHDLHRVTARTYDASPKRSRRYTHSTRMMCCLCPHYHARTANGSPAPRQQNPSYVSVCYSFVFCIVACMI